MLPEKLGRWGGHSFLPRHSRYRAGLILEAGKLPRSKEKAAVTFFSL
jgi:hypothetical protein